MGWSYRTTSKGTKPFLWVPLCCHLAPSPAASPGDATAAAARRADAFLATAEAEELPRCGVLQRWGRTFATPTPKGRVYEGFVFLTSKMFKGFVRFLFSQPL